MTDLGDREFLLGKTAVKPAHRSKKAMVWPLAFLLVLVWFLYTPLQAGRWFESDPNQSNWTDIRLPTTIVPRHYSVDFELDGSHFAGQVTIQLDISKPTRFLVVHSLDIGTQFKSLSSNISAATPLFTHIEARHKQEYCVLFFDSLIKEGGYVLQLDYNGTLSKSMEGFYESKYRAADGSMRSLATTQFEPTSARRAFPCLDEPEMKAVFEISIIVNTKYHALSNMPVREKKSLPGKTLYSFQPTVKMSSYLIAFIISDFESISKKTKNGILVSVYTPPGKTHLARYALDAAVGMLDYYQSAYGIEFPLPKCDLIAIPDFAAGAMENWGLVTFRDTALLFDPKTSTAGGKERVAEVVAHELAHQWFGNLVTMKWWNDLWLNEGFAEFMEYKAVNSFEPTWKMLETFIPNDLVRALHADESAFTHSIALPVQDPNEISNIFDDISYGKGSSVIRMLESWMDDKYGPDYFFSKLHNYLAAHAYSNAETSQLWEALRTADQDVGKFMSTWTDQPGFPVVILRSVTSKSFTVDQERFLISNLINVTENVDVEAFPFSYRPVNTKKQLWSIPLTFGVYSNATGTVKSIAKGWADFTDSQSMEIKFEKAIPEGALVLFNHQQTGVYRSLYDIDTYYTLLNWLKADKDVFPAVERAGLFSDIFSMSFSGRLTDPIVSLELIKLLHSETNVLVWETALKDLETLKDIFALTPAYGAMLEFQARLQDSVLKSVGWIETSPYKADHHIRGKLRGRLLAEAIRNGHKQTTATALRYFALLRKGQDSKVHVSPDAYGAIYNAGIIHGDLNDYKWVQSKYLNSNFAAEQQMYLHALASSPAPHLQAQTLAFAISGKVRQQDITSLVSNVATLTPVGHISVWLFFMENWDDLTTGTNAKTFGINFLMLGKFNKLLQTVTGAFTKQYLIKEAENLFIKRIDPDFFVPQLAEVSVMKGLETAKQLLAWRKLNGQKVSEWLDKNTGGNKITSF